jgi:uncharacterized Zn finger protein
MSVKLCNYEISPHLRQITHEQVTFLDQEVANGVGWELYCSSYIRHPAVLGNTVSGLVRDDLDEYYTEVQVDDRQVKTGCSCGQRNEICKHAIALLYGWVNDNDGFQNVADVLERLRDRDKESLIEILGRMLMFDPRNISFLEEEEAEENFEDNGL